MTTTNRFLLTLFGTLLLVSCASPRPVLVSKSALVPAGIDLSGSWSLRADPGARGRLPQEEGIRISKEQRSRSRLQTTRSRRGSKGMSAQVFIENGENLKVTQTAYGLFISYDRSVVEEYTFGENREVTIGPIEAQRVSGWNGNLFVAETLDKSGNLLLETWGLQERDVLERHIRLMDGDKEMFSQQQIFDRR